MAVILNSHNDGQIKASRIIWYILDLLEVLLLFRFGLKLLGANPDAGFTSFIYSITYPFAEPFLNVFRVTRVAGSTFEWTTLLAMFVYWLIAYGLIKLLFINRQSGTTTTTTTARRVEPTTTVVDDTVVSNTVVHDDVDVI